MISVTNEQKKFFMLKFCEATIFLNTNASEARRIKNKILFKKFILLDIFINILKKYFKLKKTVF